MSSPDPIPAIKPINPTEAIEYWTDAFQRSVLFWDVLRERAGLAGVDD